MLDMRGVDEVGVLLRAGDGEAIVEPLILGRVQIVVVVRNEHRARDRLRFGHDW